MMSLFSRDKSAFWKQFLETSWRLPAIAVLLLTGVICRLILPPKGKRSCVCEFLIRLLLHTAASFCGWLERMISRDLPVSVLIRCSRFDEASASRKTCSSTQQDDKLSQSVEIKLTSSVTNIISTFDLAGLFFQRRD